MWRTQLMTMLFLFGVNGFGAASCDTRNDATTQTGKPRPAQTKQTPANQNSGAQQMGDGIETLSGGIFSIGDPLVVVARDTETYAALRALSKNGLPEFNSDYFKSHAVIAAFLGQRRTGGYSVRITGEGNTAQNGNARKIVIEETTPPKGAMVAQVITAPFKVVSVAVGENHELKVAVGNTWMAAARPFQISTGEFTATGGFAGRSTKLQMQGTIGVLREGTLATFLFNANGVEAGDTTRRSDQPLMLREVATGVVDSSGKVTIKRMESGTFVPIPHPGLQANGKFEGNAESKLWLTFSALPTNIADGYGGSGKLEATATAPPRPKKQVID